ncbi:MAG: TOBE domain-containing protein, partial [Lapillicoccus sp.]
EPLGAATLLTVDVDGQVRKVQTPPTERSEPHQEVWLHVAPEAMRLYDKETGLALLSDRGPSETDRKPRDAQDTGASGSVAPPSGHTVESRS